MSALHYHLVVTNENAALMNSLSACFWNCLKVAFIHSAARSSSQSGSEHLDALFQAAVQADINQQTLKSCVYDIYDTLDLVWLVGPNSTKLWLQVMMAVVGTYMIHLRGEERRGEERREENIFKIALRSNLLKQMCRFYVQQMSSS